jgi:hypothetical protein
MLWNLNIAADPAEIFEIPQPVTGVCFMPDVKFKIN